LPLLAALVVITFVGVFATNCATADDTVGVPWTGSAGTTETVAQIMAREKQLPPQANAAARQAHRRLVPSHRKVEDTSGEEEGPIAVFVPLGQNNQPAGPFSV